MKPVRISKSLLSKPRASFRILIAPQRFERHELRSRSQMQPPIMSNYFPRFTHPPVSFCPGAFSSSKRKHYQIMADEMMDLRCTSSQFFVLPVGEHALQTPVILFVNHSSWKLSLCKYIAHYCLAFFILNLLVCKIATWICGSPW